MAALYDRVSAEIGRLYEGRLAAKDQTIATQAGALADLRDQLRAARLERFYDPGRRGEGRLAEDDDLATDELPGWWDRLCRWRQS